MNNLSQTVAAGLVHYFDDFRSQVFKLADRLNDRQFWSKPYPYGNSFGNLVLHLTGNLSYYIGAQIEQTGYIRDREREFAEVTDGDKTQVLANLDAAVSLVTRSLAKQQESDWSREYTAVGAVDVPDRYSMYLRCCVHFHHHIGQMTYLVKEWECRSKAGSN
jgi:uncharacterized damage-inducible protein DinB